MTGEVFLHTSSDLKDGRRRSILENLPSEVDHTLLSLRLRLLVSDLFGAFSMGDEGLLMVLRTCVLQIVGSSFDDMSM